MASVCTVRDALIKSTRTGSERFVSRQGMENAGILYVFPIFRTEGWGQKIRCPAENDLFILNSN